MSRTEGQWKKGIGLISPSEDLPILLRNDYLNFGGSLIGESGYGIRNNAGVMEVKSDAGAWAAIGGGTTTVDALIVSAKVNEAGGIIAGQVVYLSGATGGFPQVSLASNDDYTKSDVLAIANETKTSGQTIAVTLSGIVENIDTSSFTEGQLLYLGTAGNITTTHPTGLNAVIRIGRAIQINVATGSIGFVVDSLTEVDTVDDFMRSQIVNTSTGTSAVTNSTLINDADHYVSLNINGSNSSFGASETSLFTKGYGDHKNILDGNKGYKWFTDVSDLHNGSYTEKMALSPAGNLTIAGTVNGIDIATDVAANTTKVTYPSADSTKVGHISVTQAVDLDQMETDINALSDGMTYKGDWDASVGTFPGGGTAQTGAMYYVSVGGTVDSVSFAAGDNIISTVDNASTTTYAANWSKHDQTDAVASVNSKVGSVLLTMQDTFDEGQSITIADGDNQTLIVTQNDTTNNPNAITVTNNATASTSYGLEITASAGGRAAKFIEDANSYVELSRNRTSSTATSHFYRDLSSGSTASPVVFIEQDNVSDDQDALKIQQDGTGRGITLDINGNARGINIDSEATTQPAINIDIVDGDAHIRLVGDSGNASPTEGDLWRESTGLNYFDGTTEVNLLDKITATSTDTLTNKTLVDAKIQTTKNAQTGTTYTLVLTDASKYVSMSNASANTLTVPPNSSVAFATGTRLMVQQLGAGATTIAAGAGVTINAPTTVTLAIAEQYESRGLLKSAVDTWELI